jgi:hypothetical protein
MILKFGMLRLEALADCKQPKSASTSDLNKISCTLNILHSDRYNSIPASQVPTGTKRRNGHYDSKQLVRNRKQ